MTIRWGDGGEGEGVLENRRLDGCGGGGKGQTKVGIHLKAITDANKGRGPLGV